MPRVCIFIKKGFVGIFMTCRNKIMFVAMELVLRLWTIRMMVTDTRLTRHTNNLKMA